MDYTSAEFDIREIDRYTLLIRAGKKEHAMAVVDEVGNLLLLTAFDLDDLHSQAADILDAPFTRVLLACSQHAFTFVPDEVYDGQYLERYASFVSDGVAVDEVVTSHIPAIGVRNVYAEEPFAYYRFTERFPHARVIPDTNVVLEIAGGRLIKKQGIYLGIDIHESQLALYCFNKGQFLFYNTFEIADENDFNYHLLHVMRGLGLSWEGVQCILSGHIAAQDPYHRTVTKYTEQVEFADTARWSRLALPDGLQQHQHRYLTLMGLYACES